MIEVCNICKGCSSRKSSFSNLSSPKKLLIAISIVAIITMCIMPTEARSLEHRRHEKSRRGITRTTKDIFRRQNRRSENLMQTKDSLRKPKNPRAGNYTAEFTKIMRKVRNTKSHYDIDWSGLKKHVDNYSSSSGSLPKWLPSVNFVDLHFHNYRRGRTRTNDTATIPERKYVYQVPRLFRSLLDFYDLFKRLESSHLNFPDDPYNTYKRKREEVLKNTLGHLYSTIQEVKDSMSDMNLNKSFMEHKPRKNLKDLNIYNVGDSDCRSNDYIAFRAFGNMLHSWYLELWCKGERHLAKRRCKAFHARLGLKRDSRLQSRRLRGLAT